MTRPRWADARIDGGGELRKRAIFCLVKNVVEAGGGVFEEEVVRPRATPTFPAAVGGREAELRLLLGLLNTDSVRLVTVTGTSGIGKTVVADEAVSRLTAVTPLFVRWVGLREMGGIEEARSQAGQTSDPGTRGRRNLWVVDGADSSAEAPTLIAEALDLDPALQILATSVSPLRVSGEHLVPLGPLALPSVGVRDAEQALASPAVRLFCACVRTTDPGFTLTPDSTPAVVELCIALDGMPLALELAAARSTTIGVDGFLHLYRSSGLEALTSHQQGSGDRHQSLPSTIEWTCSLLSPSARVLLRQLTAFVGGFNWLAVVALASDDDFALPQGADEVRLANDLSALVSTGLVRKIDRNDQRSVMRYTMPGPIRQFLVEQWDDPDERTKLRRRHAEYYRELARRCGEGRFSLGGGNFDQELITDRENLTAALAYSESEGTVRDTLSFAVDLEAIWMGAEAAQRGARHLSRLLEAWPEGCNDHSDAVLSARGLALLVLLDAWSRQPELGSAAHTHLDQAIRYVQLSERPDLVVRFMEVRALVLIMEGSHGRARAVCGEALGTSEIAGDHYWRMRFLTWRAIGADAAGDFADALEDAIAARDMARAFGDDHQLLIASHVLTGIPGASEDPRASVPDPEALLELARRLGDLRAEGLVLISAALRNLRMGDLPGCARRVLEALELARRTGTWYLEEFGLFTLVVALTMAGRTAEAVELHGAIQDALPGIRSRLPDRVFTIYDLALDRARDSLGQTEFDCRMAAGALHTWSSALSLAEKRATEQAGQTIPATAGAFAGRASETVPVPGGNERSLSRREIEVLRLIASGCSNKDVASSLNLRPKTVMHYTSSLYRKLEVRGRAQAVAVAWDRGLLEANP
jgi:predicted ATPase/DNA-binding CsgD family transcriptional regulator